MRGPTHVVKTGKTPVLDGAEWRTLLDSIPAVTLRDLRDRALIATLTYSLARINAALKMTVEDLRPRGAGWTIRLHEKGGKHHAMPSCARRDPARLYQRGRDRRRPQGVAVPDVPRARRQYPVRSTNGTAGRLAHDPSPGQSCGYRGSDRKSHIPRHWDHRLPFKRRPKCRSGSSAQMSSAANKCR